jgi:putative SOS response-associated peptidase YedK
MTVSRGDKPCFRTAFRDRCCLIMGEDFHEWADKGKPKQPFHIGNRDRSPLGFGGLWDGVASVSTRVNSPANESAACLEPIRSSAG